MAVVAVVEVVEEVEEEGDQPSVPGRAYSISVPIDKKRALPFN